MNHIIITTFTYPPGERFDRRMEIYKKYHLDSLYKQTLQNFDIGAICHPDNNHIFKEMGIIPINTKDGYDGHIHPTRNHWEYYTPWENIDGLKKYKVQTGLDTDNFLEPNYVEKTFEELEKLPEGNKYVQFQPMIKNILTGEEKKMSCRYNNDNFGSAMFSISQTEPYYFIYHDGHTRMQNLFENKKLVGEGYCWVGIHDENVINDMNI